MFVTMNQRTISAAPTTPTCFLGPACSWIGPGDPVAINPKHHVLAAGDYRFNVLSV